MDRGSSLSGYRQRGRYLPVCRDGGYRCGHPADCHRASIFAGAARGDVWAVCRPVGAFLRHDLEIDPGLVPNKPAAGQAGIALLLTSEHHCSGLPEPERSITPQP